MATVSTRPMTAEEFFEWASRPENQDKYCELERGEIVPMPPPGQLHGALCAWIAYLLWSYVLKCGKGHVCSNDTGLIVERNPDTVRGADVMLFAETIPLEDLSPRYPDQLPQLVVEVLSPNDRQGRTNRRISQYLKRGIPLVWLVDPEVRSITVYQPGKEHYVAEGSDVLTGNDVLPNFQFTAGEFFTLPGQSS
jgi:Uma2 family endonuclease